jgi:hypothetical protein
MTNIVHYVDKNLVKWFQNKYSRKISLRKTYWETLRKVKQQKGNLFEHWKYERLSMGAV